jgi:cobalt/nickel transport system permease protein
MIIFGDLPEQHWMARIDPRTRVAAALAFSFIACVSTRPVVLGLELAAAGILLLCSGMRIRRAACRLATLNGFMLLLIMTVPLFEGGTPLLQCGPLTWTAEGTGRALTIAARSNAIMLTLTALLGNLSPPFLAFGLAGLGVSQKFTHLLLFMVRYTEVIHEEYHRLRDAMTLRCFRLRCNRHSLKTLGFLIGQLLLRSVNRSERILEAMKCRGFSGHLHVLTPCRFGRADIVFLSAGLSLLLSLAFLEWS